jgi:hypothetical protein
LKLLDKKTWLYLITIIIFALNLIIWY